MCMYVLCVRVCEREREGGGREGGREREREGGGGLKEIAREREQP